MLASCTETALEPTAKQTDDFPLFTEHEKAMFKYLDNDFTFEESEARKHALDIAKDFDKIDGKHRVIKEVKTLNLPLVSKDEAQAQYTKTDSAPELYMYNFNPSGFAIISADERSLGHITSSVTGQLDSNLIKQGYGLVLQGAVASVLDDRIQFKKERDSFFRTDDFWTIQQKIQSYWEAKNQKKSSPLASAFRKIRDFFLKSTSTPAMAQASLDQVQRIYSMVYHIEYHGTFNNIIRSSIISSDTSGVLLKTNFHQRDPYNLRMKFASCYDGSINGRYPVGCVATAHSQVLLYYNTQATRNRVPYLQELRDYHYLNVTGNTLTRAYPNYPYPHLDEAASILGRKMFESFPEFLRGSNCNGTFAPNINGQDIINPYWGFNSGAYRGYNFNKVVESIRQDKPVIARGFRRYLVWFFFFNVADPTTGHVWVIDGIKDVTTHYRNIVELTDFYTITPKEQNPSGWSMDMAWPVGSQTVSFSSSTSILNNELHHNFGWGRYATHKAYAKSDWLRDGVFQPENSTQSYHVEVSTINYITPR